MQKVNQICGSGMFIPGPDPTFQVVQDPDPDPDPTEPLTQGQLHIILKIRSGSGTRIRPGQQVRIRLNRYESERIQIINIITQLQGTST